MQRLAPHASVRRQERRVAVIGSGYVGLTAAACLVHLGHRVHCTDVLEQRVENLRAGDTPIVEEGLEDLLRSGLDSGRLTFGTDNVVAAQTADTVFLCLPTPQDEDGTADLSYIREAAAQIGPHLKTGAVVVNKSTVPVGASRTVRRILKRDDVSVVSNPEFLREGTAIRDFLDPDRIVIGSDDEEGAHRVAALYSRLGARVVFMDPESAELLKYASNSFLAMKISFVNSIAALCEGLGANIQHVTTGMGLDARIGDRFLEPGPGWGGSCFPKDSSALLRIAEEAGFDFELLRAAVDANETQYDRTVNRIEALAGGSLDNQVIAMWGLAFKANTDDARRSPAIEIANRLTRNGARVQAYDPAVTSAPSGTHLAPSALEACNDASVLVVATEWAEFRSVDLVESAARMRRPVVLDTRSVIDAVAAAAAGFEFHGIGLAPTINNDLILLSGVA